MRSAIQFLLTHRSKLLWVMVLLPLASCGGCTERTPNVCCTSDTECAQLGLPPGSANDFGCSQGQVCRDFYCIPDDEPDASTPDAPVDAPAGRCDPNAPFGTPTRLANVNSQFEDLSMAMIYDQLKAYFVRSTGTAGYILMSSQRSSIDSHFPAPTTDPALAAVTAGQGYELYLYPTSDDLVVYYRRDLWFASHRLNANEPFNAGAEVYVDGTPLNAGRAMISADSLTLYFSNASSPLRASTHGGVNNIFANNRAVTTFDLTDFAISADELILYYSNYPNPDIFRTTRVSKGVPFDPGIPLANVNTTGPDIPLYVSPDDCSLYIRATMSGSVQDNDIWVAIREQ